MNSNTVSDGLSHVLENEWKDILNLGIILDEKNKAENIVNNVKQTIDTVLLISHR